MARCRRATDTFAQPIHGLLARKIWSWSSHGGLSEKSEHPSTSRAYKYPAPKIMAGLLFERCIPWFTRNIKTGLEEQSRGASRLAASRLITLSCKGMHLNVHKHIRDE
jgi:hypothetical protein